MDPFFGNRRWYQNAVPIHEPNQKPPVQKSSPKVVKIPVHFIGSNRLDRSAAAVKIQRVFRGFLVRKCVKKIKDVKSQAEIIREKLSKIEVVKTVRTDQKERLRMNESLMCLLLKLDSICGVDFGVRLFRKSVIRTVISLQERIDSIAAVDFDEDGEIEVEGGSKDGSLVGMDVDEEEVEVGVVDVGVDSEVKVVSELKSSEKDDNDKDWVEEEKGEKEEDKKRNGVLMESLLSDNEKMMNLMTKLIERNDTQMRMLNALTHRVELLEKAFVCDKLRKKKNKNKEVVGDVMED